MTPALTDVARSGSAKAGPAKASEADKVTYGTRASLLPPLSPAVAAAVFDDFRVPVPAVPLRCTDEDISTLGRQRLSAVALRLAANGRLQLTAPQVESLRSASFAAAAHSLRLVGASRPALDALRAAGIPFAVSKGPGIALAGCHPTERPFSDLDLIVAPRYFGPAFSLLTSLGYEEPALTRPPWRWFNSTCREAVNLRSPEGGSLDLHHHVPPWLWTRSVDLSALVGAAELREFHGHPLPLVQPAHNLLIVSLHVVSDHNKPGATLMVWRDLLTMAAVCDPQEVLALADRHRLTGWLHWIIEQFPVDVRPAPLSKLLAARAPRPPYHFRLSLLTPPAIGSRHMIGQAFRLPISHSVRYLVGMTVPSPSFLEAQFPNTPRPYFHWWSESVRHVRRSPHVVTR